MPGCHFHVHLGRPFFRNMPPTPLHASSALCLPEVPQDLVGHHILTLSLQMVTVIQFHLPKCPLPFPLPAQAPALTWPRGLSPPALLQALVRAAPCWSYKVRVSLTPHCRAPLPTSQRRPPTPPSSASSRGLSHTSFLQFSQGPVSSCCRTLTRAPEHRSGPQPSSPSEVCVIYQCLRRHLRV